MPIQPIYLKIGPNWPNWQCCLAGGSKTAPRIFIFSIVLGAEYLSYAKSIATYAPTFFGYIISILASVYGPLQQSKIAIRASYYVAYLGKSEYGVIFLGLMAFWFT